MSKLVALLEKAGQQLPAPIGFGPASSRERQAPQIILVARVLSEGIIKNPSLGEADADAFLVGADEAAFGAIASTLEKRLWGVRLSEFGVAQASMLTEKGCDFIVFESMATEASVLNEEDLGVIATITAQMDEETTRALNELPLDGVLFGPGLRQHPLSVETAVEVQKALGLLDKPLIVEAPEGIGQRDLELLRDIGVAGLIVDLDTRDDIDRMAETRRAIEGLPRRKARTALRGALLPHGMEETEASPSSPGEDDYDEDDF